MSVSLPSEGLFAENGFGGFSKDGREYVIRLVPENDGLRLPPRPWINVVANQSFGFLVSETGAGNTWSRNSHERRLTPWTNDPVSDPHSEALYVRDEAEGRFWSPIPGPAPAATAYEVRHGFGSSTFRCECDGILQETVCFVPCSAPVKIVRVRLADRSGSDRRLSVAWFARLVLGSLPETSGRFVVTARDPGQPMLFARSSLDDDPAGSVFAAAVLPDGADWRFTTDRASFVGPAGSLRNPALVLDGRTGAGLDPCFAQEVTIELPRGKTAEISFLLGEAGDEEGARVLAAEYGSAEAVERALGEVREFWNALLSTIHVETPAPAIDLMVNGWLLYQTLGCRMWGRSALYQAGGAFGYRDQLQDASAFAMVRPEWTRAQILLHAAHQFPEGDVLHWWHPPASRGLRTRFSDDLLWLPFVTAEYVAATGDRSVLEARAPFRAARRLRPEEDEAYLVTERSSEEADVYEHSCRALDLSLTAGAHGLPLFGTGDWNDAMNRVGREGRGESVWLGFFLSAILDAFLPFCRERGDAVRVARYTSYRERLGAALESAGWDGAWYRRGYYDGGEPLGAASCEECRIDLLSQSWSVLSGAASHERARRAMESAERELVSRERGIIRLLAPPFDKTANDPGYIKGYPPGVRENGGQYTHAAMWGVRAAAELGWNDRAAAWLEMLSPVAHTKTEEEVRIYRGEPYVMAGDVGGEGRHVGRAGWTWYTGSSGWMFRTAVESVLGFRIRNGDTIEMRPCIPDAWPGLRIGYRVPGEETHYVIEVVNPARTARRVVSALLDGTAAAVEDGAARVPLVHDGRAHRVEILLGGQDG